MSFIQSSSNVCARQLATKYPYTRYDTIEDQISVYDYGFQVAIGGLVKIILLVGLSLLFGVLKEAIIISLTFASFRILAGGFHFGTYFKCIMESLIFFIGSALVVKYTLLYWTDINIFTLVFVTILSALYIIIRYVPRDNPHKRIDRPEEIKKFKKWSSYYLIGWTVLTVIYLLFNAKIIIIASSFGLLLELFSISEFGYHYVFEKLDGVKKYSL